MATGGISVSLAGRRHLRPARCRLLGAVASALGALAMAILPAAASPARSGSNRPVLARRQSKQLTIGFILASPVPTLIDMGNAVKAESQRLGMKFVYESDSSSPSAQLSMMGKLISEHVSAIVTSPLVAKPFEASIKQARSAGILVLAYDGTDPGLTMDMTNDDYQAGYDMVGFVAKHLRSEGRPCEIALLDGVSTALAFANRDAGMAAGERANGCTALGTEVDVPGTLSSAATIVDRWRTRFTTKLQAIVSYDGASARGAVSALGASSLPIVAGFGSSEQDVRDVISGRLWEDFAQQSSIIGEGLAWAAHQVLTGHSMPATVYSPYVLITKSNASGYKGDTYYLAHPPISFQVTQVGGQYQLTYSGS